MKRTLLAAALLACGAAAALAQADAIKQRQTLMKQNSQFTRTVGGMLRGQAPFGLEQAQAALRNYQTVAQQLPNLFPDDSKTGGDTAALPVIWTAKADFLAAVDKFGKDATAALATVKDDATFKAELPKVLQNCQACHDKWRKPMT